MKSTRSYSMDLRARGVEGNRLQIQQAVVALAERQRLADIPLGSVAELAGLSVRTLLRLYGTKENLFRTVADELESSTTADRPPTSDDVDGALRALGEHYETTGRLMLMLLSQEDSDPLARHITTRGKAFHRRWVCEVFDLNADADADVEQIDMLVVCTDLYTWKLLRHDRELSQAEAVARIANLVHAVQAARVTSNDHTKEDHS